MPYESLPLATSEDKKKLGKMTTEIDALREKLRLVNSALNGNRKSLSTLTGGKKSANELSVSDHYSTLRETRSQLERQLQAFQKRHTSFLGEISSRKLAKAPAAWGSLPTLDKSFLEKTQADPAGTRKEMEGYVNKLMEQVQTGAEAPELVGSAIAAQQYAAYLDAVNGEGPYAGEAKGPGANQRQVQALVNQLVAKTVSSKIPTLEPQGLAGPAISAVPTAAEEQSALGLADSMQAAAPMPQAIERPAALAPEEAGPRVGLADVLQRIAPASSGPGPAFSEGTLLNSGQGPMTAPTGQQLVFRSAPGGGIQAGTTPIGTPGKDQFDSAFRPSQELTQRLNMPAVGEAQPGQEAAGQPGPVAMGPAVTPTLRRIMETGSPTGEPPPAAPSFPGVVAEDIGRKVAQVSTLPLRAVGQALSPLAPLGRGFVSGIGGEVASVLGQSAPLPAGLQQRVELARAAEAPPPPPAAPSALGQPAPAPGPTPEQQQQSDLARMRGEAIQLGNALLAQGKSQQEVQATLARMYPALAGL